ncbi:MAG: hypothetical protein AABX70_07295 [Nanoarchaeota archaeon]
MAGYISVEDLVLKANSSPSVEGRIKETVRRVEETLAGVLSAHHLKGEVVNVGSTNRNRFTASLDPNNPYGSFMPDIDLYVVTDEKLSRPAVEMICEEVGWGGFLGLDHGVPTHRANVEGLRTDVSFIGKSEEARHAPLLYARSAAPLTSDQLAELKGLGLFLKNAGVYGGWHGGIKRLAAEQLILAQGSMLESLRYIHDRFSNGAEVHIPSPLDGHDLTASVQPDAASRLFSYARQVFEQDGKVPDWSFSWQEWRHFHTQNYFFYFNVPCNATACGHTTREIYDLTWKFLRRTGESRRGELYDPTVFVLPFEQGDAVFISCNDWDRKLEDPKRLQDGLNRRVESFIQSSHK